MRSAKAALIVHGPTVYATTERGGGYYINDVSGYKTGDIVWIHFDIDGEVSGIELISHQHTEPEIEQTLPIDSDPEPGYEGIIDSGD